MRQTQPHQVPEAPLPHVAAPLDSPAENSVSEGPRIEQYYAGKRLLVIGGTGLVGRVLVEKLLHDLPGIDRIYVLIRPRQRGERTIPAKDRMWQELFASSAFDRLRQDLGKAAFTELVENKVHAVSGDLGQPRLGLDDETYGRLQQEVDLIINCAALVSFDAPLDAALSLNTLGPLLILEFAKGANGVPVAHVSTCYVNATRDGAVPEEPVDPTRLGLTAKGAARLPSDIDAEVEAIQKRIRQVREQDTSLLHRLGFALKACIRLTHRKPAADTPQPNEAARPQPDWVEHRLVTEGMRWARYRGFHDTYTLTKTLGEKLVQRHRGDVPTLIMRPSVVESALESPEPGWLDGMRMIDPLIVAYGRNLVPDFPGQAEGVIDVVPVDMVVNALVATIPGTAHRGGLEIHHIASGSENPLQVKRFCNLVREVYSKESHGAEPTQYPELTFPTTKDFLRRLRYRYSLPLFLLSWLPTASYFLPKGRRIRSWYRAKRLGVERLTYYARIYGPYAEAKCLYLTDRTKSVWDSLTAEEQRKFNFDVASIDWREYIQDIHIPGVKRFVLGLRPARPSTAATNGHGGVEKAQSQDSGADSNEPANKQTQWVRHIPLPADTELDKWIKGGRRWLPVRLVFRWILRRFLWLFNRLSSDGMANIPSGPFILASNHCSHFDTGVLMALLYRGGKVHPMAAKDYFFRNRVSAWIVRNFVDGAPFDRQSYTPDSLSLALGLLSRDHSLLYFPEGGRSPDGTMRKLKPGVGLLALEAGVPVVPAYISGSYQTLPKGRTVPRPHPIHVRFGPPLYSEPFLRSANGESANELVRLFTEEIEKAVKALR